MKNGILVIVALALMSLTTSCKQSTARVETDYVGYSHLFALNTAFDSLYIQFIKVDSDTLIEVSIGKADTAYLCKGDAIGGWLRPSEIIHSIMVTPFDSFGNAIGQSIIDSVADSLWNYSDNSTWENSYWYYKF